MRRTLRRGQSPSIEMIASRPCKTEGAHRQTSKKSRALCILLLHCFLWGLFLVMPTAMGSRSKYFTFFYLAVGFVGWLRIKQRDLLFPRRMKLVFSFLVCHLALICVHRHDIESVFNLSALMLSYYALYLLSIYCKQSMGFEGTLMVVCRIILLISIAVIPISIFLTALHWPSAPEYFPWECIGGNRRLLLLFGGNVGHSSAMWLMAFACLYLTTKAFSAGHIRGLHLVLMLLYVMMLALTRSRTGLLLIVLTLLYPLILAKPRLKYAFIVGVSLFTCTVYLSSLVPQWRVPISDRVYTLQKHLPWLRIVGSSREADVVFTGRDLLNQAMLAHARNNRMFGLGDGHPIFAYGVDASGEIALTEDEGGAKTESILVLCAKYGVVYFALLLLVIVRNGLATVKSRHSPQNCLAIASLAVLAIALTGSGVFLQLYSTGGLFAFLIFLCDPVRVTVLNGVVTRGPRDRTGRSAERSGRNRQPVTCS